MKGVAEWWMRRVPLVVIRRLPMINLHNARELPMADEVVSVLRRRDTKRKPTVCKSVADILGEI